MTSFQNFLCKSDKLELQMFYSVFDDIAMDQELSPQFDLNFTPV